MGRGAVTPTRTELCGIGFVAPHPPPFTTFNSTIRGVCVGSYLLYVGDRKTVFLGG